ncbi:glycerate kinase family protein [Methylopila turkensis]|uniref:Glycerate kinase n=1 Tax=Methylopila turkensis TaxID=1437816 RepID=A0A9W6N615_9HYPH|nr:glycerate kinase [Methylopila turkensis]GLK79749.1 glycerate kinase [Methylopila turkensis]
MSIRPIRVLLAPSGFKESLGVSDVIDEMAKGVAAAAPDAEILRAPMVDGGEGFTETLVELTGGSMRPVTVTGPVGAPVEAFVGFLGGLDRRTAVIEMAAAAGLRLVPRDLRDPGATTSFGVGELIRAALDLGAERILIGCGDSGINDAGAGMAQALGVRLLDAEGRQIGRGGAELARLARVDLSGRDPRLDGVTIDVAVNWHNVLLGERGVARVFGPQKGATPAQVEELAAALETFASVVRRDLGVEFDGMPGAGASGGLGAGLHALIGATLRPRWDVVMAYIDLDQSLAMADLVITAEGSLDGQTPFGKAPAEIARRAKRWNLPVIALAGTVGQGAASTLSVGVDAYFSILTRPCSMDEAVADARRLVREATEQAVRLFALGRRLDARGRVAA